MRKQMRKSREFMKTMFDVPEQPKQPKPQAWYYITRHRDSQMMVGIASDGSGIWADHDLQYTIPHMYNSSMVAKRDLPRTGGHAVKMSRYQTINGKSVWSKR